jgi:hypothetical protein
MRNTYINRFGLSTKRGDTIHNLLIILSRRDPFLRQGMYDCLKFIRDNARTDELALLDGIKRKLDEADGDYTQLPSFEILDLWHSSPELSDAAEMKKANLFFGAQFLWRVYSPENTPQPDDLKTMSVRETMPWMNLFELFLEKNSTNNSVQQCLELINKHLGA